MKTINKVIFVLGDVLLPCVYKVTLDLLKKRGLLPVDRDRVALHGLDRALLTGSLKEHDFLLQIASLPGEKFPITENDILSSLSVDRGSLSVAADLRKDKEVVLFSDYPKPWLKMIDRNADLTGFFSKVIYSQDLGCSNLREDIFIRLIATQEIQAGTCLWVDGDPLRTSMAIRNGIDAIIYVDERRLRRELHLRALL